ncbi:MAPEG family protein [Paraurantiacibacter namhicola]|uniref:MAPEG family protein n=1 Tax=Paraurantiacibacter namhicola TaxID=645517 RepID=A0A1C7DA23_9SPHN|nr:MAPEG family protein [Paraurantiacibacter namhicola]ANU08222.1 MAPEG family protein [Paraurantiacibacter namhicola]
MGGELIGMGILKPMVLLAAWTMVVWLWMYATRLPAMKAGGIDPDAAARDPDQSLNRVLPPQVQWKADNYNHLHEAPTVFYAVAIVIALTGTGDGFNEWLGWAYLALRVAHSLVQAVWNRVIVRFAFFTLSSLVLIALVLHAAMAVF